MLMRHGLAETGYAIATSKRSISGLTVSLDPLWYVYHQANTNIALGFGLLARFGPCTCCETPRDENTMCDASPWSRFRYRHLLLIALNQMDHRTSPRFDF